MARTTPPTCGAISTPCVARSEPMAVSVGVQVSVPACVAATEFVGWPAFWMKPLIIAGFTTIWK